MYDNYRNPHCSHFWILFILLTVPPFRRHGYPKLELVLIVYFSTINIVFLKNALFSFIPYPKSSKGYLLYVAFFICHSSLILFHLRDKSPGWGWPSRPSGMSVPSAAYVERLVFCALSLCSVSVDFSSDPEVSVGAVVARGSCHHL